MAAVNINIPDDFQSYCDKVTDYRHSLSWIIFHTNTAKQGIQTKTKLELLGTSGQLLKPSQILDSIRENIQQRAGDALPAPQFILCNIPVQRKEVKKSHLYFISLCPDGTPALVNFTHASSQMPILTRLALNGKVFQNRCLSITSLDELTLDQLDPDSTYDDSKSPQTGGQASSSKAPLSDAGPQNRSASGAAAGGAGLQQQDSESTFDDARS